jgi:hypothetical protein
MPRIARADRPGSWNHITSRAIARRTLFERRENFRLFLAALACAVRSGEIEVHAFYLMGTHYHLLIRSLRGELGNAMRRIQLAYSRWFNRSRRRDGSLVRCRYSSILVGARRDPVVSARTDSIHRRQSVSRRNRRPPCRIRLRKRSLLRKNLGTTVAGAELDRKTRHAGNRRTAGVGKCVRVDLMPYSETKAPAIRSGSRARTRLRGDDQGTMVICSTVEERNPPVIPLELLESDCTYTSRPMKAGL